jgi:hypothetical protein
MRCWHHSPKHLFSGEQDYLCIYYITQQVPVRVSKELCHGLIDWITWNVVYSLFRKVHVDTYSLFYDIILWWSKLKVPWMAHHDFPKRESGFSDILALVFRCTSKIGLWMTSIHWVITNIYPKGVANHRLICIYFFRRKPSIASMNNPALWPYFFSYYL